MRRQSYKIYLLLVGLLLAILSVPKPTSLKWRGGVVATLAPSWEGLQSFSSGIGSVLAWIMHTEASSRGEERNERLKQLELENAILKEQIKHLKDFSAQEEHLKKQLTRLEEMGVINTQGEMDDFLQRRYRELGKLLQLHLQAIPSKVVYRGVHSWNSSLWINVGEATNNALKRCVVAKNSPVVVGDAIVGVVDFVGEHQSRVRLITDSGLVPSVRAVRGGLQDRQLCVHIDNLREALATRQDFFISPDASRILGENLDLFKQHLKPGAKGLYLAKGEIHGASAPLWRHHGKMLRGIGFNYDFADEEGPARDLRTGKPVERDEKNETSLSLLQVNDLLVTTGMDGVFPPGFLVAQVTKVEMLREGSYVYELEAQPVVGDMDELKMLFVMPPLLRPQEAASPRVDTHVPQ